MANILFLIGFFIGPFILFFIARWLIVKLDPNDIKNSPKVGKKELAVTTGVVTLCISPLIISILGYPKIAKWLFFMLIFMLVISLFCKLKG